MGGVSCTLKPPSELRVYMALVMAEDWEVVFDSGVLGSLIAGFDDDALSVTSLSVFALAFV